MPALTKGSSTADRFQVQSKIVDFQEGLRRRSLTKQNPVGDTWDLGKKCEFGGMRNAKCANIMLRNGL